VPGAPPDRARQRQQCARRRGDKNKPRIQAVSGGGSRFGGGQARRGGGGGGSRSRRGREQQAGARDEDAEVKLFAMGYEFARKLIMYEAFRYYCMRPEATSD
jgi:hypothetical protein